MSSNCLPSIAEINAERRRRHDEVDRDCDCKLAEVMRLLIATSPTGVMSLKAASLALKVSEKTVKRWAIKYRAGSRDSFGHWRVDVGAISAAIDDEHRANAAFADR